MVLEIENNMSLKPCIECGKECEILPVQLGDLFTLCLLRVCSGECMFLIAYEFMRDQAEHKQFRKKLYDLQNEEDKKERDDYVKEVTDESLKMMREHFEANPNMLSTPAPNCISELFASRPEIPHSCGKTVTFTRPCMEDRIKWARQHVQRAERGLAEALKDLDKLELENL
jgi:hypothetical protein